MNEIKQALPLNPVLSTSNDSLFSQKVIHLKNQLFPLTRLFFDKLGNALQIWSAPESQPIALLQQPGGSTRFISSDKIKNSLNPGENSVTLHNRLLVAPDCRWDFVLKSDGSLEIWPHLEAQGWREAIPKENENFNGILRLARGKTREKMCSWFYRNGYKDE